MKKDLLVFLLFFALTMVMNYPRTVNLTNTLDETGDSLLNTWILAWDVHKLTTGMEGYFDGNIFYPHKKVLAYSEYLLASALLALPATIITDNPIFGYNVAWVLSFILSGWGMYLLVFYLVKNRAAGIIAGIIFAFAPYKYGHLSHLQLLTSQWIPFTYLYLHKFFDRATFKNIALLAVFYILTVMSCGYYALFTTLFMGLYMGSYFLIDKGRFFNKQLWIKLFLFVFAVIMIAGPFYYQYYSVKKNMGFERTLNEAEYYSADITSYFTSSPSNRVYGNITKQFWKPEGELFLGITPILIAIFGLWHFFLFFKYENRQAQFKNESKSRMLFTISTNVLTAAIILYIGVAVAIIFFDGFHYEIKGPGGILLLSIKGTDAKRAIVILFTLILMRLLISRKTWNLIKCFYSKRLLKIPKLQRYYFAMFILAFLFSLGPTVHFLGVNLFYGPYLLLYYFVPGFDGLRVPARLAIMVFLALSVLSGYGFKKIWERFSDIKIQSMACLFLSFLLLLEFNSAPLSLARIKTGKDIPSVYKWLSKIEDDVVIAELPMKDLWDETSYMYYSTYHWKKLVNGFSGYEPPAYLAIRDLMQSFPTPTSIKALKDIRTDYVILHSNAYTKVKWETMKSDLNHFKEDLKLVNKFNSDYVYELINMDYKNKETRNVELLDIPSQKWVANSNRKNSMTGLAFDGNFDTRWNSGIPQEQGIYFMLDLGDIYNVEKIIVSLRKHLSDYPRNYVIEASRDGKRWEKIGKEAKPSPSIIALLKDPKQRDFELKILPVTCRYLKITLMGQHHIQWSINEIRVYQKG